MLPLALVNDCFQVLAARASGDPTKKTNGKIDEW